MVQHYSRDFNFHFQCLIHQGGEFKVVPQCNVALAPFSLAALLHPLSYPQLYIHVERDCVQRRGGSQDVIVHDATVTPI